MVVNGAWNIEAAVCLLAMEQGIVAKCYRKVVCNLKFYFFRLQTIDLCCKDLYFILGIKML